MESSIEKHQRNLGTFIHVSTFSKYFIPFWEFYFTTGFMDLKEKRI